MTKNFSNTKKVGHYHSGAKIHSGMIDYTFCSLAKWFLIEGLRISCEISNNIFYIAIYQIVTNDSPRNLFGFFASFLFLFVCFSFVHFSGYFVQLSVILSVRDFNLINFFVLSKGILRYIFASFYVSELIVFNVLQGEC